MLKHVLLAGGMMIAAPVLAQTSPTPAQTSNPPAAQTQPGRTAVPAPAQTPAPAAPMTSAPAPTASTAPTGDAITAQTSPATPAPTAPADPVVAEGAVQPATPAAAAPQAAQAAPQPAQPAPAQPAAQSAQAAQPQPAPGGGSQVQQIVGREFAAYDKNGDGKLSQGEFDAWMVALKTASDPATKADSPETKQWLGAAFAQADADKSRDLTQAELTGFLSQGQS